MYFWSSVVNLPLPSFKMQVIVARFYRESFVFHHILSIFLRLLELPESKKRLPSDKNSLSKFCLHPCVCAPKKIFCIKILIPPLNFHQMFPDLSVYHYSWPLFTSGARTFYWFRCHYYKYQGGTPGILYSCFPFHRFYFSPVYNTLILHEKTHQWLV